MSAPPLIPISAGALSAASNALPATGVAIGLYIAVALLCIVGGWAAQRKAARMRAKANR
jgi:hypothetical protein